MIALLDNMQILIISKKLVNKLHSVGPVTSLWLGVTQRITNETSNFVTYSNNITYYLTRYSNYITYVTRYICKLSNLRYITCFYSVFRYITLLPQK